MRKAQKKIAEENIHKAVKVATQMAEVAASDGKAFCISHVKVGLDAAAVREAVLKVLEQKVCLLSLALCTACFINFPVLLFMYSFKISYDYAD